MLDEAHLPGLTWLPLGPWMSMELSSPWCLGPRIQAHTPHPTGGMGGVGTVSSPLCLEQLPNSFSSVINTQRAPEGTC